MAHYTAELIEAVEHATPEERPAIQKKCFDTIMELWSHRSELPNGKRPFEELEPVTRAIESLDPESQTPRYYPTARTGIVLKDEAKQTQALLKLVSDIDSTARILIGHALAEAARTALKRSKEWVVLAEAADADSGVHDIVIRYIIEKTDVEKEPDAAEWERERLQDRLKRVESFTKAAAELAEDLRMRIQTLKDARKPKAKTKRKGTKSQPKPKPKKISSKKGTKRKA